MSHIRASDAFTIDDVRKVRSGYVAFVVSGDKAHRFISSGTVIWFSDDGRRCPDWLESQLEERAKFLEAKRAVDG